MKQHPINYSNWSPCAVTKVCVFKIITVLPLFMLGFPPCPKTFYWRHCYLFIWFKPHLVCSPHYSSPGASAAETCSCAKIFKAEQISPLLKLQQFVNRGCIFKEDGNTRGGQQRCIRPFVAKQPRIIGVLPHNYQWNKMIKLFQWNLTVSDNLV